MYQKTKNIFIGIGIIIFCIILLPVAIDRFFESYNNTHPIFNLINFWMFSGLNCGTWIFYNIIFATFGIILFFIYIYSLKYYKNLVVKNKIKESDYKFWRLYNIFYPLMGFFIITFSFL